MKDKCFISIGKSTNRDCEVTDAGSIPSEDRNRVEASRPSYGLTGVRHQQLFASKHRSVVRTVAKTFVSPNRAMPEFG